MRQLAYATCQAKRPKAIRVNNQSGHGRRKRRTRIAVAYCGSSWGTGTGTGMVVDHHLPSFHYSLVGVCLRGV